MADAPFPSLEDEQKFHTYRGSAIPFYVRLLWVGFYTLAIFYALLYLFPAIRSEFQPKRSPAAKPAARSMNR